MTRFSIKEKITVKAVYCKIYFRSNILQLRIIKVLYVYKSNKSSLVELN